MAVTQWHSVSCSTPAMGSDAQLTNVSSLPPCPKVKLCLHAACLPSRMRECRPVRCWQGPKPLSSVGTRRTSWRTSARWVLLQLWGAALGFILCEDRFLPSALGIDAHKAQCDPFLTRGTLGRTQQEFSSKPQWAETATWGAEIVIHAQELVHPLKLLPLPGCWSLDLSLLKPNFTTRKDTLVVRLLECFYCTHPCWDLGWTEHIDREVCCSTL